MSPRLLSTDALGRFVSPELDSFARGFPGESRRPDIRLVFTAQQGRDEYPVDPGSGMIGGAPDRRYVLASILARGVEIEALFGYT